MMSSRNAGAILILDDEFDILNLFTLSLKRQGFQVDGFTEPMLALDHFQKNSEQYLLVVSDIRLPIIDISIYKKSQGNKPDVRVFCMSAFLSDDVQYGTGLTLVNVDEYIEKPVSVNDFIRLVKKYLRPANQ